MEVEAVDSDTGWAPYLSLPDARKLDEIREARRKGDLKVASRLGRIYQLKPVAVGPLDRPLTRPVINRQPVNVLEMFVVGDKDRLMRASRRGLPNVIRGYRRPLAAQGGVNHGELAAAQTVPGTPLARRGCMPRLARSRVARGSQRPAAFRLLTCWLSRGARLERRGVVAFIAAHQRI